jgi:hypothetical protein
MGGGALHTAAVVGLGLLIGLETVVNVLQVGADPITDGIEAATIAEEVALIGGEEVAAESASVAVDSATAFEFVAADGGGSQGGLNLFKYKDSTSTRADGWRDGDYFLRNVWQGSPKATWLGRSGMKGNSGLLRQEMAKGKPIYDSYVDEVGNLIPTRGFLNAERYQLESRGWSFDPSRGAWLPS